MPFDAAPAENTSTVPVGTLALSTLRKLRKFFNKCGHRPSEDMWAAMEDLAKHLELMADGAADPYFYLSSLDPGVGKSQTIVKFVDTLLDFPGFYGDVGVVICVASLGEVVKMIESAQVPADNVCVMTSDEKLNALGVGRDNADKAQVLITTQQMVEYHLDGSSFTEAEMFWFQGAPRRVRVWDEAYLPGQTITLTGDDLGFLFKPLRGAYPSLNRAIIDLFKELDDTADGTILQLPDYLGDHGVDLNDIIALFETYRDNYDKAIKDDQRATITSLWMVSGNTVTIRRDGRYGNAVIDYKDTLPADLAPMVITDASGRVRETYTDMEKERGILVPLRSAPKRYDPLTVHVWRTGGGKGAFDQRDKKRERLVTGVAETVMMKPAEDWLIVIHRADGKVGKVEKDVRAQLLGVTGKVDFISWGNHKATNRFSDVPNVILAGTLFYRASYYEALTRLAKGRKAEDGAVTKTESERTQLGEHRHLVLQALCRGSVRRSDGDRCHPMDAYIICSVRSGIRAALPDIFPHCEIVDWMPVPNELRGAAKKAFDYVRSWFDFGAPGERITFRQVVKATGIKANTFKQSVRRSADYVEALATEGIVEYGEGRYMTSYCRVDT